jgi:hypothetical protein
VLLLDRGRIGEGTTAQSSWILRIHYTVSENVLRGRRRGACAGCLISARRAHAVP